MRPDAENPELSAFCSRLVAGSLRGGWIDGHLAHVAPRLRLIKDIRSTLMLRWFHGRFPAVPLLYLLRHPCAVVLSRMRLEWATDDDVRRFLCQAPLVRDYLRPYLDVIARADADEEKHAVIWCISNLVPLRQFATGGLTLLHYETLRQDPRTEVARIFSALGLPFDDSVFAAVKRPSRTTRHPRAGTSADGEIGGWKRALTAAQIDRVLAVVEAFGLGHTYGDSTMPLKRAPAGVAHQHEPRLPSGAA
jgi:hypothetical protein